ncbi:UBN2_3 domain-containing protein, partial [Cephalotus follicularis]
DFNKLERFDGGNFYRWQKKMFFLLTTLKVYYVINVARPEPTENETMVQIRERQKWIQDDEICRGHILNAMSNTLFDAYHNVPTAKELWTQLEARYMKEDAASKGFLITKFNSYKMMDTRSVMEQFHEIKNMLD